MAQILDVSERDGACIYKVNSKRGEERIINADELVKAWVDFSSEIANEVHFGWAVSAEWYAEEIRKVNQAATVK